MQPAVDELVPPPRSRGDRGEHIPWAPARLSGASGCSEVRSPGRRWWPPPGQCNEGFDVHSLHAYFLRPGDPDVPILYEVDRIRDGRSFVTRRVVAIQHGKAIFHLQASFHVPETSYEHQVPIPEGIADPEALPDFRARMAPWKELLAS